MHRVRVYADTSVFGGVCDEEFAEASHRFFSQVARGKFTILLSNETVRELMLAPGEVRSFWQSIPADPIERVMITEEARALAEEYVRAAVVGEASQSDALHVAMATVAGADLILEGFREPEALDLDGGLGRLFAQKILPLNVPEKGVGVFDGQLGKTHQLTSKGRGGRPWLK